MKIVVLAGGLSPERDVSLSSGSLIANALSNNGHGVALVDLYIGVKDYDSSNPSKHFHRNAAYRYIVGDAEPDLESIIRSNGGSRNPIGENVIDICLAADRVFLALHGAAGENGQLQAVFDCYGIKYTGSGYAGSLLAMDKDIAKRLFRQSGVLTADWISLDLSNGCEAEDIAADSKISISEAEIGYPCVVKPRGCGSSVGVSIVNNRSELKMAFEVAKKYEGRILIEKKITGREFSVGILNGEALPVIEIIPKVGFYDYKNKYQSGFATEVTPAQIDQKLTAAVQKAALLAHNALMLGSYSRVDFILDEKSDSFYCLEANTLPGMTPTSLFPQEAAAAGISYAELCEIIAKS